MSFDTQKRIKLISLSLENKRKSLQNELSKRLYPSND